MAHSKPSSVDVHIGVFNSKKSAQNFFESLPTTVKNTVSYDQLWLDVFKNHKGFIEHHINIANVDPNNADIFCKAIASDDVQCVSSSAEKLFKASVKIAKPAVSKNIDLPLMLRPLGLRMDRNVPSKIANMDLKYEEQAYDVPTFRESVKSYGDEFSFTPQVLDTPEAQAAKAGYEAVRGEFVTALRVLGDGVNAGQGDEASRAAVMALGQKVFNAASSAYLSGFLEEHVGQAQALSSDAGSGETFVHHVKKNLKASAQETLEGLINDVAMSASSGDADRTGILSDKTDTFMLSGAQGLINAGLSAARRSDLYALRHMELEYNLNNFEDSYLSVLLTQPVYQSVDLRHNIFLQGGGIVNEQSVDIDDDTSRHTVNFGAAYRYLTVGEKYLLGGNIFFDHQWPYNHSRVSVGLDAKAKDLGLAANYYYPLSNYQNSRTDAQGFKYEERALEGYDLELGYTLPFLTDLTVYGKGYQYFRETDDDIRGIELSAEYKIRNNFTLKGSVVEENGGRDGVELALQYRMPLYDTKKPNLVLADIEPAAGSTSVRSKIFEKVRRENRIRVEERLKETAANEAAIITAQFSALSIGAPFDVGGVPTGAGVNLPFDTAITVPNGDFGIITFSNGAIANISASGGGDVILEFNATTLTVTATNGGFVQFISGSGGISVVNVPGGMVNLLGTDIDVTDDGVTTTIQVRAGQIDVVPAVGVAVLGGNQADIVSLTIATGATSLLAGGALETRQEAAYTNLDLLNPDPPATASSAPFINVAPALITGPQFVGNNADLRLTFTQAVTVAGAPFINALVGINARTFAYNAGASTPTQLVFRHVLIAGDLPIPASITITDLDLNGGTIIGTSNTLSAITAFTPTVVAITDQTAPMLVSSTPPDNEPAFAAGANIVLNFDETVVANIGNITITDTTDGSDTRIIPIGDAQVSIVGATVTINLTTNLEISTDYDITILSGVIEDTAGNAFAGLSSGDLNFTTSADSTPPMLMSTVPADNDTSIAVNTNLTLNFNENVQAVAGNIVITDTTDGSDVRSIPIGDAQVSIVGSAITINPTTDLDIGTAYDVTIAAGVIEDTAGNAFAGIASGNFNFTTIPITSLAQVTGLSTGNYIVNANAQTFTGYVTTALGSSWLLVGKGREGWQFDANGQGTNAGVAANLGVVAGFSPNAYEEAIVDDLITNAGINLTGVEIRIHRAADVTGTAYQEVLWRPTVQVPWVWSFDTTNYQIIHDVQASILGGASSSTRNTRDAQPANDHTRIFTWAWGTHASMKGFAYGNSVSGTNGNDPNTFMWENTTENHAIPYAEIYIRAE